MIGVGADVTRGRELIYLHLKLMLDRLSGGRAFAALTTSSKRLLCSFIYSPDRGKSLPTPLASDYRPHYPHPSKVAITHANFRCTKERIVIYTRPVSHTRVDAAPAHPRPGRKATNGSIDILILHVARSESWSFWPMRVLVQC